MQPCTHDQVYLDGPNGKPIDLDSPECIEHANQMRMWQFCQDASLVMSSNGLKHRHNVETTDADEEYNIHDGNVLLHQRHKRAYESDSESPSSSMALVSAESKSLNEPVHQLINELCRRTSLIRIKLGFEYEPSDYRFMNSKEMDKLSEINNACSMIGIRPTNSSNHCGHVYDSIRQGIFYANKTFKLFEEFWQHNNEICELIRQDRTFFERKRNNLLHQMYHLRGVYNFDETQNAWAVGVSLSSPEFPYFKQGLDALQIRDRSLAMCT